MKEQAGCDKDIDDVKHLKTILNEQILWKISETGPNWECGWRDNGLFQMRYFISLPISRKSKLLRKCATSFSSSQNGQNREISQ